MVNTMVTYEVRREGLREIIKSLLGINSIRPFWRISSGEGYGYFSLNEKNLPSVGQKYCIMPGIYPGFGRSDLLIVRRVDETGYREIIETPRGRVQVRTLLVFVKPYRGLKMNLEMLDN